MAKILIFDDDVDILEICSYILTERGFEVHVRERCDDVIEVMNQVEPDLVLMDNWIPDMGGVEATIAIKKHKDFKKVPVVYFTANNDVQKLAEQAGADNYIAKPFELKEFEAVISDILGKG